MRFTFDPVKSEKNIVQRELVAALAAELDWESAFHRDSSRIPATTTVNFDCVFLSLRQGRLYAVVVTPRKDELRVISFRKANRKEEKLYEQHSKT